MVLLAANWAELFWYTWLHGLYSLRCILAKMMPIPFGFQAHLAQGFHYSEPISFWTLEHLVSWVPCTSRVCGCTFFFFFQHLKKISSLISWDPTENWWSWLSAFSPPLLSQVSILVWLQWKIPLRPSVDECSLFNYIEFTEINFYNPNRVSPWVPVLVRWSWTHSWGPRGPSGGLIDSGRSSVMSHFCHAGKEKFMALVSIFP